MRERFAKTVSVDDPGENVRTVGPEAASLHNVEKIVEHDVVVWAVAATLDEPAVPAGDNVPGEDPPVGALTASGVTVADTGPDAAKSPLVVGTYRAV